MMGILIILMVIGITAGRFAIARAADIVHKNAADSLYKAMQAYYIDHREFPDLYPDGSIAPMIFEGYALYEYIENEIDFGGDAIYSYYCSEDQQDILVCVTLYGIADSEGEGGYVYCTGNGFGSANLGAENIRSNDILHGSDEYNALIYEARGRSCNWYRGEWQY